MSHNIWFTSDSHFNHYNVIKYSGRPWETVEDMNEGLIERWNECVKKGDTVYHLGDFTLTMRTELIDEWLGRLNGTIRLVRGNHDNWVKRLVRLKHKDKFKWIDNYKERRMTIGGWPRAGNMRSVLKDPLSRHCSISRKPISTAPELKYGGRLAGRARLRLLRTSNSWRSETRSGSLSPLKRPTTLMSLVRLSSWNNQS